MRPTTALQPQLRFLFQIIVKPMVLATFQPSPEIALKESGHGVPRYSLPIALEYDKNPYSAYENS